MCLCIEGEVISTAATRLIRHSTDQTVFQMAQQKRTDCAMRKDCNVLVRIRRGNGSMYGINDPGLSVNGSLPSTHAHVRIGKELVCNRLELRFSQISCR